MAAGIALLALAGYLGTQRDGDAVTTVSAGTVVGASSERVVEPVAASAADTREAPTTPHLEAVRAVAHPTAAASAASDATAASARLKVQLAKKADPSIPLAPAAAPVAVYAPPSRAVVYPMPQAPSEPVLSDPREACHTGGFIARALCINERCGQAAYASHAACVKLRRAAEDAEQALQRGG